VGILMLNFDLVVISGIKHSDKTYNRGEVNVW
jgi:hypothetical protein